MTGSRLKAARPRDVGTDDGVTVAAAVMFYVFQTTKYTATAINDACRLLQPTSDRQLTSTDRDEVAPPPGDAPAASIAPAAGTEQRGANYCTQRGQCGGDRTRPGRRHRNFGIVVSCSRLQTLSGPEMFSSLSESLQGQKPTITGQTAS